MISNLDYNIVGTPYCKYTKKKKLPEASFIKDLRPTINKQEKSVPLTLLINIIY